MPLRNLTEVSVKYALGFIAGTDFPPGFYRRVLGLSGIEGGLCKERGPIPNAIGIGPEMRRVQMKYLDPMPVWGKLKALEAS